MEKEVIKYTTEIDNRFWEMILKDIKPGHAYSYPEAMASIMQRAFSSQMLMGEEWFEVSASVLAGQFGWYRLKAKKFIDFCEEIGILSTKDTGRRRLARVVCLKIKKSSKPENLPVAASDAPDRPSVPQDRFNFSDSPRNEREGSL